MLYAIRTCALSRPFELIAEGDDLLVFGEIRSSQAINIRVRNLVILGSIITPETLTIHTVDTLYNAGKMSVKVLNLSGMDLFNGIVEAAAARVRALGIALTLNPDNSLRLGPTDASVLDLSAYIDLEEVD